MNIKDFPCPRRPAVWDTDSRCRILLENPCTSARKLSKELGSSKEQITVTSKLIKS